MRKRDHKRGHKNKIYYRTQIDILGHKNRNIRRTQTGNREETNWKYRGHKLEIERTQTRNTEDTN